MNLRRMLAVARKEWIQIKRDPRSLGVVLLLPIVLLVIMGYGVDFDLKELPFAFCDLDASAESRRLRETLAQSDRFRLVASVPTVAYGDEMLRKGECLLLVVAPSGFSEALASGESVALQMLLDGSDSNTASVAKGYIEAGLAHFSSRMRADRLAEQGRPQANPPITVSRKILYNPALESRQSIVPGLIVIILVILGALLTAGTVVRERERGTFETLAASPVGPAELLLGKLLPYVAIGMADVIISIATGALVFRVHIAGSVELFLLCSLVFLLAALGVGLAISTVAAREQVAMLVAILVTLLPALLLSGFVYPVRNMPLLLQGISKAVPATHFLTVIRAVYLKGVGLGVIWPQMVVLLGMAAALFGISVKRFRKQL